MCSAEPFPAPVVGSGWLRACRAAVGTLSGPCRKGLGDPSALSEGSSDTVARLAWDPCHTYFTCSLAPTDVGWPRRSPPVCHGLAPTHLARPRTRRRTRGRTWPSAPPLTARIDLMPKKESVSICVSICSSLSLLANQKTWFFFFFQDRKVHASPHTAGQTPVCTTRCRLPCHASPFL